MARTYYVGVALVCTLSLLSLSPLAVSAVYVYKGDPFQPGPLDVDTATFNTDSDGIPKRTEVFFPTLAGTYIPVLFVPGVFGAIYTEWYSTVLSNLASYGVVVAGVDVQWPLLDGLLERDSGQWRETVLHTTEKEITAEPETLFEVLEWLMKNLGTKVENSVAVDWGKLGIMSHSLGAMYITEMLQTNHTFAKAAVFLDPASSNFHYPLNYSLPALTYGTQFDMEKPECCKMGNSYFHYYSLLSCPKLLMNVTGFGHCDINDDIAWDLCHAVHFCKTDPDNDRDLYRKVFLPGVLASFFGTFLQGNPNLVSYITHRDDMPLPLGQLWFDLNCTSSYYKS